MSFKFDEEEVGAYINGLIEFAYPSARKFCIAYLEERDGKKPDEDQIKNMENRLSQIKKGKNSIQAYDLLIFTKLLNVSCEQILSAGKSDRITEDRLTNFSVSHSHKKEIWEKYIEIESTPILNPDEYGNTLLDYAIKYCNYGLIKFLIDKNYIWFDSGNKDNYGQTFGAGTNIQRVKYEELENNFIIRRPNMNDLECKLASDCQLRISIISLASDHSDIPMLEKLRAREIPALYYKADYLSCNSPDIDVYYDKKMVSHIANSSDKVLKYFTDEFEIINFFNRKNIFVFPYITQLLDLMIENNSNYLPKALEKMIQHNKNTEKKLCFLINESIDDLWKNEVTLHNNGNIIHFRNRNNNNGIITNIATVTKESKDCEINRLIMELNNSYNNIKLLAQ